MKAMTNLFNNKQPQPTKGYNISDLCRLEESYCVATFEGKGS
jgi:hypothetical protein